MRTGLILSVFPASGLCAGGPAPREPESILKLLQPHLSQRGISVRSWEPVDRKDCYAVLIYAECQQPGTDLLELRRHLGKVLEESSLQLRLQREDVFLAMHRL